MAFKKNNEGIIFYDSYYMDFGCGWLIWEISWVYQFISEKHIGFVYLMQCRPKQADVTKRNNKNYIHEVVWLKVENAYGIPTINPPKIQCRVLIKNQLILLMKKTRKVSLVLRLQWCYKKFGIIKEKLGRLKRWNEK